MKEEPSIEELCAPLSAKKMPKSQLYTSDHRPRTGDEAIKQQRITSAFGSNWSKAIRDKKRKQRADTQADQRREKAND